jgi:regulatory protein
MKISKISEQVKNKQKLNIFIDGNYQLSLTRKQVADLNLVVDLEISDEMLVKLKGESVFTKYYQKSLDFLARRARSESEVRKYIIQKSSKVSISKKRDGSTIKIEPELEPDEAEALAARIVEHLKQKKFLDDEQFAIYWARARSAKNLSNKQLKQDLIKKGLTPGDIESAIAKLNEQKPEQESLSLLVAKLKTKSRYQDSQKLMRYLASRGFSYQQIKDAITEAETLEESEG